jgi:hypothetical protein
MNFSCLMLGIGRRPLNVIIREGNHQSATKSSPLIDPENPTIPSSQPLSTRLETSSVAKPFEIPNKISLSSLRLTTPAATGSSLDCVLSKLRPCLNDLGYPMLDFMDDINVLLVLLGDTIANSMLLNNDAWYS